MKTLADRLIKHHLRDDPDAVRVAALLKRPERNHGDRFQPAIERFIIEAAGFEYMKSTWARMSIAERGVLLRDFKVPMPKFWVETPRLGYLYRDETVIAFGRDESCNKFTTLLFSNCEWIRYETGRKPRLTWGVTDEQGHTIIVHFLVACLSLTQPRMATVERIVPKGDGSARAQAFRRAMRGAPVYSFNRVTITLPRESRIGGEVQESGAGPRKRLHWVSGHWRLIDWTKAAPYWTWVPGHKKGCEDLGEIVKERHIRLAPGSMGSRRGFWLPTHAGAEGERVAAVPVMSRAA